MWTIWNEWKVGERESQVVYNYSFTQELVLISGTNNLNLNTLVIFTSSLQRCFITKLKFFTFKVCRLVKLKDFVTVEFFICTWYCTIYWKCIKFNFQFVYKFTICYVNLERGSVNNLTRLTSRQGTDLFFADVKVDSYTPWNIHLNRKEPKGHTVEWHLQSSLVTHII